MLKKSNITTWVKNNAVALIAACAALVTACLVPPDAQYAGYFDWRTLSCLFCILGLVAAFRHAGFFEFCSNVALRGFKTTRQMVMALTFMTGAASMFITNDMALILFLPLSTIILLTSGNTRIIPFCFIMQTLAANLMGMIMPFGNPQNLFLFSFFEISLVDFLRTMVLPFAVSVAGIFACCFLLTGDRLFAPRRKNVAKAKKKAKATKAAEPANGTSLCDGEHMGAVDHESLVHKVGSRLPSFAREKGEAAADKPKREIKVLKLADWEDDDSAGKSVSSSGADGLSCALDGGKLEVDSAGASCGRLSNTALWAIYGALFLVTLTGVFRVLPFWVSLGVVAAALIALDRKALQEIDWGLLLTFVFFFVFSGNMARIPEVSLVLSGLMESHALLCSALLSQVISNVPSAVLLAQFTANYPALLIGVNVGGAGTVVGSLASLITLNHFRKVAASRPSLSMGAYMAKFSAFNFAFLLGLLAVCSIAGF